MASATTKISAKQNILQIAYTPDHYMRCYIRILSLPRYIQVFKKISKLKRIGKNCTKLTILTVMDIMFMMFRRVCNEVVARSGIVPLTMMVVMMVMVMMMMMMMTLSSMLVIQRRGGSRC